MLTGALKQQKQAAVPRGRGMVFVPPEKA